MVLEKPHTTCQSMAWSRCCTSAFGVFCSKSMTEVTTIAKFQHLCEPSFSMKRTMGQGSKMKDTSAMLSVHYTHSIKQDDSLYMIALHCFIARLRSCTDTQCKAPASCCTNTGI